MTYCGWKKSCTTLDGWTPINNGINGIRINHLPTGAGFLPSTVFASWLILLYIFMRVYSNRFPNCSGHHIYIYTLKTHVLLYITIRYTVYIYIYIYSISIYIHIPWNITTYPKSPVHFWSPAVRHPLGTRQLRSVGPSCGEPSQAPGPSSSGARVGEERVSSYQCAWFMIISHLNKLVNIYIYIYIYLHI